MPQRSLFVLTTDQDVRAACEQAAADVPQAVSSVTCFSDAAELAAAKPEGLVVVDPLAVAPQSVHEWALPFLREHRSLLFLLTRGETTDADGLARFVGAQGAVSVPVPVADLAERLASPFGVPLAQSARELPKVDTESLEENLGAKLDAILGQEETGGGESFVQSITDPETGLYAYEYWEHRLEEEFKRSSRFRSPLGLAAFRVESMVEDEKLLDVASVILLDTRDVDVVTRFDESTFLALLPHTGPEGVRLFAERVVDGLRKLKFVDLNGSAVEWSTAQSVCPDSALGAAREFLGRVLVNPVEA